MSLLTAALHGVALGDALGRPAEFNDAPNAGIALTTTPYLPFPALVTDDTQLAISIAEATPGPTDTITERYVHAIHHWATTDHHKGRAPGATCLQAGRDLTPGTDWTLVTHLRSKGAGGVMRGHAPTILLNDEDGLNAALLQGALTHGHPTAIAAQAAWHGALTAALHGVHPESWINTARAQLALLRTCPESMAPLANRVGMDPDPWWTSGVGEVTRSLTEADIALDAWTDRTIDPCTYTGPGWVAEEAVAGALLIAVAYARDPLAGIVRAARTSGDSDTLASMVGALLGAHHGDGAWPPGWVDQIETPYKRRIAALRDL